MSMQLVLSVTQSSEGKTLGDWFSWCWLGLDGHKVSASASGDSAALRESLRDYQGHALSAWLILPGARVATRELEYSEKEKKHLRSLLPYQLEDDVIGDVDDFHFALSPPANGRVTLAFTDRDWLQAVFAELATFGLEITRCWSAPLTLPQDQNADTWTMGLYDGSVRLRYNRFQGFEVAPVRAKLALQLLLEAQGRSDNLPNVRLLAASEENLAELTALIPEALQEKIVESNLVDVWSLDYSGSAIDLCQGEFSQRLPIERWWKLWKSISIFAAVCVVVYIGGIFFEMHKIGKENIKIRQQIEAAAREVIPQGRIQDAEKQTANLLRQMAPTQSSGSALELLAIALPQIAAMPSVQVKGIAYTAETNELNINIQADSFSAFQALSENIISEGLNAELLSANVQGNIQSARLKVSKPQ